MQKKQVISRRNFIKSGTILSASTVLAADPCMLFLASVFNASPEKLAAQAFACELFRAKDLLQLKFFFFNAKLTAYNTVIKEVSTRPLFIYCQIPPQHVGEELLLSPFTSRNEATRKKSFLSGHTWLAFWLLQSNSTGFPLTPDSLLDWEQHFELVTLDSFAVKAEGKDQNENTSVTFTGYNESLPEIKEQFKKFGKLNQDLKLQNKWQKGDEDWPITTFEVPYKLFLSPIAEPNEEGKRIFGQHAFRKSNKIVDLVPQNYKEDGKIVKIYNPWNNELIFRTYDNRELNPRFKVVHYLCQDNYDKGLELLPAPIHRDELHGLTMRTEPDRDVIAETFRFSALGSTANLRYKNDNPTKDYSTVAWEQKIVEARDNYVSVTFRAIDVFTGLKLNISIIAERAYKLGVSYLPKLYYVSYAENEKNFQNPITISKVPFVKIIPKTKGAYFTINPIPENAGGNQLNTKGYVVAKSKITIGPSIDCDEVIPFDYIGVDKDGNEHNFKSKIIFIPAETYQLVDGTYKYEIGGKPVHIYQTAGEPISIEHIGLLNPSKREGFTGQKERCPPISDATEYTYRMIKSFSIKTDIDNLLNAIRGHVLHESNASCYEQTVLGEVSYASLNLLKKKNISRKIISNGEEAVVKEVRPDSKAASFETDKLLLFSVSGELVDGEDNYLNEFPLIPKLVHSNVVISQINQIEGRNVYRKVKFADDYTNHNYEIDQENENNKVRLLFKLVDEPENFFSKNYKSAGALVNPGIDIKYISVLDQGITYNDTHNAKLVSNKSIDAASNFSSSSIFQNLDAKILGIPLLAILEDVLPVEDLPVFSYLKDAQETVKQLDNLVDEYKKEFEKYKDLYNSYVAEAERWKDTLGNLDETIGSLNKDMLRSWVEGFVQESGVKDLYNAQKEALDALEKEYKDYTDKVLIPVMHKAYDFLDRIKVKEFTERILNGKATYDELLKLYEDLDKVNKEKTDKVIYVKELVKIYIIQQVQDIALNDNYDFLGSLLFCNKLAAQISEKYIAYHNALTEGLQEAALFYRDQVALLASVVYRSIEDKKKFISQEIKQALKAVNLEGLDSYILVYSQLTKMYENYKQLMGQCKAEYYKEIYRNKLGIAELPTVYLSAIEKKLIGQLKTEAYELTIPTEAPEALKKAFSQLKNEYNKINEFESWLSNYHQFGQALERQIHTALQLYEETILKKIDFGYSDLIAKIADAKGQLLFYEERIKNFVQDIIDDFESQIKEKERAVVDNLKGSKEYNEAVNAIAGFQKMVKKLKEYSKQSLDYTYSTKKFKSASLGVIEFIPESNTELDVKVNYQLEFKIDPFKTPALEKQTYITSSSLSNFRIGLMQFLYIDFERVKFVTGSDVKDEFVVAIRDVQFAGMLSFVQAFQEFLKSIDNKLVFDINSSGVSVGYGFAIPDFPAGYFNFFNLSFSGLLTLPFDPKKSLQLKFGLGSELSKFGITVCGIFGGQGYFNIIAETGRGIIGMEMALEFGAIFNLNVGFIANGTAYLVGGIYIRTYNGTFLLKGYILCVGRFNIIGLFSANLSFYLGLEYDGDVLSGSCHVTASKKFSRFFEISVTVRMDKTISGAKKEGKNAEQNKIASRLVDDQIIFEDTNLSTDFYAVENPYLILTVPSTYKNITTEIVYKNGATQNIKTAKSLRYSESEESAVVHINVDKSDIKDSGAYSMIIKDGGLPIYEGDFNVIYPADNTSKMAAENLVNASNYYESYF